MKARCVIAVLLGLFAAFILHSAIGGRYYTDKHGVRLDGMTGTAEFRGTLVKLP